MIQQNSHNEIEKLSYCSGYLLTPAQRQSLLINLTEDLPRLSRQRIQIMLMADQNMSSWQICQNLGCSQLTAEYWTKVAAAGSIEQWKSKPLGRPKKIDQSYITRLQDLLSQNPRQYGYPFQRWTIDWLIKHLEQELGVVVSNRNLKRLLKDLGLSTCKNSSLSNQGQLKSKVVIKDLDLDSNYLDTTGSTSVVNLSHDYQSCLDGNFHYTDYSNIRQASFHPRMGGLRSSR